MHAVRRWSVRHARFLEILYAGFSGAMVRLDGLWRLIGYRRLDRPVAAIERRLKGLLFDCRMCGQCILTDTGMACPMTCPKSMRNGPCGGVRADGGCEVEPAMRCVWIEAWEGSLRMAAGGAIGDVQPPLDHGLWDSSSWLRATAEAAAGKEPPR